MKNTLLFLLILFGTLSVSAQNVEEAYEWPVKGAKAGEGIIYAPQTYIDGELNFANLFITAPLDAEIISPCDGSIYSISIVYLSSLTYSSTFHYDPNETLDEALLSIRSKLDKAFDPPYLSINVAIQSKDGNVVWISGLSGTPSFKTGQKIKRGDFLGKMGHSYNKIQEPSINVSMSRNSKPIDPMSPFGIKSTFIPPGEIKPVEMLTKEQAKEDFLLYIDILKEAYPGLYNVLTDTELDEYVNSTIASIEAKEEMSYDKFRLLINEAVAKIHDSHIYLHPTLWQTNNSSPQSQPAVWYGFIDGKFICTMATKEYEELIGEEVASINGFAPDSALSIIYSQTSGYDAKVEQYKEYRAATLGFGDLFKNQDGFNAVVELADGRRMEIKEVDTKRNMPEYVNSMRAFFYTNFRREMVEGKMLNDSTAYLGLTSFALNQVQVEEVKNFVDSIAETPYLIIDVRNNSGGHTEVLQQIYSYIAGEPMTLDGYMKVNKKGNFTAADYSLNYVGVEGDIFPEYQPEEGKEGFYLRSEVENAITPDSLVNYKGKVYVLANENSISAATLFPALLVRNHRGVVVGRETRTAYHFMNAYKFMDIRLPHSMISITIPLVEIVFDTMENERVPFGRGVMPDYPVPLTLEEITSENGDAILNHALQLIENGEYIRGENPFIQAEVETLKAMPISKILLIVGPAICFIVPLIMLFARRRK